MEFANGSVERYQLNAEFHQSIIDSDIVRMRHLLANSKVDVNFIRDSKWTGLNLAIAHKHYRITRALLKQYNADVNLVIPKGNKTVIHTVCENNDVEALEILIEHNLDCMAICAGNVSPLHVCAEYGSNEACALLLNNGNNIDVNAQDYDGFTPLHYACAEGHFEIARKISEQQACNIDIVNKEKRTALHLACFSFKPEIVGLIISRGANVNIIDIYGNSPILIACSLNQHKMCDMLKSANAFIDYNNDKIKDYLKSCHRRRQIKCPNDNVDNTF